MPEKLIVETNEDGFKRSNVEAICATGKSSKKSTTASKQIGEKGFGFKAVFSIADEVHIQSGPWSFCFKHRRGEDGLGMVTPLDEPPDDLPTGVTTRITLRFSEEAKAEYPRLLESIQDLPNTTILFLQRLQTFQVNVINRDGRQEKTSFTKKYGPGRRLCMLTSLKIDDDTKFRETCKYRLFRTVKHGMPFHERRQGRSQAEIELAFPVDSETRQPKLSETGQYVSAFLPIQRLAQLQVCKTRWETSMSNPGRTVSHSF
jgi:hypothetical protein